MSVAITAPAALQDEERTCLLGGELTRRGLFGSLRLPTVLGLAAAGALGLMALVATRSVPLLIAEVVAALVAWWMISRRTSNGDAWSGTLFEELRWHVARRTGADTYTPPATAGVPRPLPVEVGAPVFVAVSAPGDQAELALVQHGLSYVSTVLEVVGGGDGLREIRETNAAGARFGRLLYALSRPHIPIDQIDISTRVLPVDGSAYRAWIAGRLHRDVGDDLRESMLGLADQVAWTGESYRTFLTICMPLEQLADRCARTGRVTPERIAEAAFEVTGVAAREATRAGLQVRAGLGPRRLGALIRHLYAPSFEVDDLDGIDAARDGFQPYVAHRDALEVTSGQGPSWWHASAVVPRDGWPLNPVGVRWLEGLVTDVTPATIRTVTAQFRLLPKAATRDQARAALLLDQAAIIAAQRKGEVSTGEKEAQAEVPSRILSDLLYAEAAGCRPTLRVTVSAPDRVELGAARERVDAAAQDSGVTRLRWWDTRHHHAHALSLPLGRGIKR